MAGRKKEKLSLTGGQLLTRGDVVRVMDEGSAVRCRVLSTIAGPDGACHASLEILEGPKAGQRMRATLKAGGTEPPERTPQSDNLR
jgi:hypothetical protein